MSTKTPTTVSVGNDLTFEVRWSARRTTLGITVDRDGTLVLALPEDCPLEEGRAFAEEKQFWVYTKLAEKKLLRRPTASKRFVEGEGHYYLGRSYRLRLVDDAAPETAPLRLYQGRWRLLSTERSRAQDHFREWYVRHGKDYIRGRVERYADRLEVSPSGVAVRPLGYRWGSCSRDGTLNFHWRTACLPARLIDYVIVHESAHIHEPRHDDAFWHRVERAMPDYERRKRELREEGGGYF
ncbi:metal-dependent hydrolase [Longibacter salinarum]|uniref:Metal-dependent hydrolase n=1 Tax=Longibacter salinarum TaxID=1850348 RepID=A0A2A8CWE2_9BACT|nr:metal-dependent hydrolase [Longibacter salinarum]